MGTLASLDQWLKAAKFCRGNPFGTSTADSESYVTDCFVDPGVYDRVKNESRATLIFAPRGNGKTVLRVMLASECRPLAKPPATHRSSSLAIVYMDFEPALDACAHDLVNLTTSHHVTQILKEACSVLLDTLWQDPQLITTSSFPDRTLLASYCRQYYPALLSSDAAFRRLKMICPDSDIPWPSIREAVSEHRLNGLLSEHGVLGSPALLFYADLVDDTPESLAYLDSPVKCFAEFVQLAKRFGLNQIYVLIDRLDEVHIAKQPSNSLALLVAPLLHNLALMETPGAAFRFFLPDEVREGIMKLVRPERFRLLDLDWDDQKLVSLLCTRLSAYSNGDVKSLGKFFEGDLARKGDNDSVARIDREVAEAAENSPRLLLQLGAALFENHVAQLNFQ